MKKRVEILERKIEEFESHLDEMVPEIIQELPMPNFLGLVDLIRVYIDVDCSGKLDLFDAIDELFTSYQGKLYMRVFISGVFIDVSIDKIHSPVIEENETKSYLVENWEEIKTNYLRGKKLGRIIGDD